MGHRLLSNNCVIFKLAYTWGEASLDGGKYGVAGCVAVERCCCCEGTAGIDENLLVCYVCDNSLVLFFLRLF